MKKLLIIAYSFPPVGGGRVQRVIKFVKFLPFFGWEPVVLTVKNPVAPEYDFISAKFLFDKIKIIRTPSWEMRLSMQKLKAAQRGSGTNRLTQKIGGFLRSLLLKVAVYLRWHIFIPDTRIGWVPFALLAGLKAIKKEKIDAILVEGEPFSSFITGFLLKKITSVPLVLDFRDEWVGFTDYFWPEKGKFFRFAEKKMEQLAVKAADYVISVTGPIINNFRSRYPYLNANKFICITNGFDPDDFENIGSPAANEKFTISYAGSLYPFRSPEYFLEALRLCLREDAELPKKIKIRFFGWMDNSIKPLYNDLQFADIIECSDTVDYRTCLRYLKASDLLLYIEDQIEIADRILPAKLFDYLGAGRPILALTASRTVREFLDKVPNVYIAAPKETLQIAQAIKCSIGQRSMPYQPSEHMEYFRHKFHRRNLTEKLASILDSAIINHKEAGDVG